MFFVIIFIYYYFLLFKLFEFNFLNIKAIFYMTKYYIKFKSKSYGKKHRFSSLPGCTIDRPDLTLLRSVGLPIRNVMSKMIKIISYTTDTSKKMMYIIIFGFFR